MLAGRALPSALPLLLPAGHPLCVHVLGDHRFTEGNQYVCVCVCAISEGIWLLMPCTVNEGDLYVAVSWVDATRLVGGVVFMRGACSSAKSKPLCRVESR
jgi:hypothetical protein